MTTPNHLALGLIIGKVTGNYTLAVSTSVLLDVDHFLSLYKHGALKSWKKFWKVDTNPEDPWGDERGVLHTLLSVFVVTSLCLFLFNPIIALTWFLAHFGHIFLDYISDSDSWVFRPFSNFKTRGFVPYYSKYEILFFVFLMGIFFIL